MIRIVAVFSLIAGAVAVAIGFLPDNPEETGKPILGLPVDCNMGERCYIQSFVDRDPGPGAADYACGSLSYDGHKGVDFRVATFVEMMKGIDIIAAAPGQVRATRDGIDDLGVDHYPLGQDCGNAVVIAHDDGWETQYCHLAKGSVSVNAEDLVETGDLLGKMGFSGRTEFPHLHLSVRKDSAPVDPFDGQEITQSCEASDADSLWSTDAKQDLSYQPGGIVDIGITNARPTLTAIRHGNQAIAQRASQKNLLIWARFFGVRMGDQLELHLIGPDGEIVSDITEIARNRAEEMRYAGRKALNGWTKGQYRARAVIIRAGRLFDSEDQVFVLN